MTYGQEGPAKGGKRTFSTPKSFVLYEEEPKIHQIYRTNLITETVTVPPINK